jgi:GGDEF domain-containing protein
MTNDIFGHAAGDALIIKSRRFSARRAGKRPVARVGGMNSLRFCQERTKKAPEILERIRPAFENPRRCGKLQHFPGRRHENQAEQSIEEIMSNAENACTGINAEPQNP